MLSLFPVIRRDGRGEGKPRSASNLVRLEETRESSNRTVAHGGRPTQTQAPPTSNVGGAYCLSCVRLRLRRLLRKLAAGVGRRRRAVRRRRNVLVETLRRRSRGGLAGARDHRAAADRRREDQHLDAAVLLLAALSVVARDRTLVRVTRHRQPLRADVGAGQLLADAD